MVQICSHFKRAQRDRYRTRQPHHSVRQSGRLPRRPGPSAGAVPRQAQFREAHRLPFGEDSCWIEKDPRAQQFQSLVLSIEGHSAGCMCDPLCTRDSGNRGWRRDPPSPEMFKWAPSPAPKGQDGWASPPSRPASRSRGGAFVLAIPTAIRSLSQSQMISVVGDRLCYPTESPVRRVISPTRGEHK